MSFGIYKIENKINNKIYVGSTSVSFIQRWRSHKSSLRRGCHSNHHLQKDWDKFSEEQFVFSILEVIENKELIFTHEQEWFNRLVHSGKKLYNIKTDIITFREEQRWHYLKDLPRTICVSLTALNRSAGAILDAVEADEVIIIMRNNIPRAIMYKFIPEMGCKIDWHPLFEKEEKCQS